MHKMTQANLQAAFAGESRAHLKYLIYAEKAEREGYPEVARLFRSISYAELVHATGHVKVLGEIGKTADNLQAAIDGESYEVEEMYPAFIAVAELQEEKLAARSNTWALEAEKGHAGMYRQALKAVLAGNDMQLKAIHVCDVCGWTVEGELPEKCPVCGVKSDKFSKF